MFLIIRRSFQSHQLCCLSCGYEVTKQQLARTTSYMIVFCGHIWSLQTLHWLLQHARELQSLPKKKCSKMTLAEIYFFFSKVTFIIFMKSMVRKHASILSDIGKCKQYIFIIHWKEKVHIMLPLQYYPTQPTHISEKVMWFEYLSCSFSATTLGL